MPGFGNKKIDQLSGGQKQRVAIARCLVLDPAVLLLDEPLGALDLKLREQMKMELKKLQIQVGTTFIYITHDQSEALVMSDHVAIMNNGRFEQVDTPRNLYARPKTPFVARFVGNNNAWNGTVADRREDLCTIETTDGQTFTASIVPDLTSGTAVAFFIRAEAIIIAPDAGLNDFNRLTVTIKSILFDEPVYWSTFVRTAVYAILTTAITFAVALPVAFYITKVVSPRYSGFLSLLLLMPFWVSELVRVYGWMILLRESGVLNHFLVKSGLLQRPVEMLYNDITMVMGLVYTSMMLIVGTSMLALINLTFSRKKE